jgi:uncharacterized RDD family membrane protein YckC
VEARREELAPARQLPERRPHEEAEGQHGGHGIAGQPEEVGGADAPHRQGPAGLHGDLPEVDASRLLQHRFHEVVVAHRDPARGQHDVRRLRGLGESRVEHVMEVRHDPVVGDGTARRLHQPVEREAVGVEDLPGLAGVARLNHLVAGGEHGHPRPLSHQDLRKAQRGSHAQLLRAQHGAPRQHHAACADVLAAAARVDATLDRSHEEPVAPALHHLLGIHGVGPRRDGRARHDAKRLAGLDGACEHAPRGQLAHHGQLRPRVRGDLDVGDGVAVHRGVVRRRHVDWRAEILREHPAERGGEGDDLGRGHRGDLREDVRLRVPDGDHAHIIRRAPFAIMPHAMDELVGTSPEIELVHPAPPRRAGFWLRALALCLDYFFVLLVLGVAAFLVRVGWGDAARTSRVIGAALRAFAWFLPLLYATLFHWLWGQTMGKMLVGVRVVAVDGGPLSFRRALGRTLAWVLAALPMGAGLALAALPDKRGLHDRLAGTRVERV